MGAQGTSQTLDFKMAEEGVREFYYLHGVSISMKLTGQFVLIFRHSLELCGQ
jgi:hypothetical protein